MKRGKTMDVKYSREELTLFASGYGVLTAIRQLAKTMASPAKCGVYISVVDMYKIAEKLGIAAMPRNDRQWFFEEVMKTAFDAEKLPQLLEELRQLVKSRLEELSALMRQYPNAGRFLEWSLNRGQELLRRIDDVERAYKRFLSYKEKF
jgi:hypothetical protein